MAEHLLQVARLVVQSSKHHGLLLVIGTWNETWCAKHCEMLGYEQCQKLDFQRKWRNVKIFDESFESHLLECVRHDHDHDGAVGISWSGKVVLPRVEFVELPALRRQKPEQWGMRRYSAALLAEH